LEKASLLEKALPLERVSPWALVTQSQLQSVSG
jgi:hypothetical protein